MSRVLSNFGLLGLAVQAGSPDYNLVGTCPLWFGTVRFESERSLFLKLKTERPRENWLSQVGDRKLDVGDLPLEAESNAKGIGTCHGSN
ncbi:hypothetical protein HZH66_013013 [Vespula vulgaris]|uniref:Secreted protein n=1 Tax=Vespula vulgaris TaxID=7454 RepID=A0A834J8J1_VESVU|nr:hypothetical protein HZH66_013013 [Vespula vulgaris]